MQHGQCFRLTRSAMAIAQRDGRNVAIMVPEGALIEVMAGPFNGTRLIGCHVRRGADNDVHRRHADPHGTRQSGSRGSEAAPIEPGSHSVQFQV